MLVGFVWLPRPANPPTEIRLTDYRMDAAVQLARQELSKAMAEVKPKGTPLLELIVRRDPEPQVLAGMSDSQEIVRIAQRYHLDVPKLSPEEYVIQPVPQARPPQVLVLGGDALGVAYGLLGLATDVRLSRPYLQTPIPVRRSPDMTLRLISDPLDPAYPGAAQALRLGYNAVMTEPWPSLVTYDKYNPAIYDQNNPASQRSWVMENQQRAHTGIAQAKAMHMKVLAPGDIISFPSQVRTLYGRDVTDPTLRYCIERPRVQALLAAGLEELFTQFPQLDGILVRTGENYPLGPLEGNPPEDATCASGGMESRRATWEFLYDEVVRKRGKLLILRAWALGDDSLHTQPRLAQVAAAPVTSLTNVTFSYKVTETDFWRYNRLNPNLLNPTQTRMIEFQAAREYEGKGAFPDYVGDIYATGPPEMAENGGLRAAYRAGTRQAWVWAKGGGWNGPYLSTGVWLDANVYATSRLLWDVDANPQQIALDWARLRFGNDAAPYVADVLAKSSEAVVKAFYPECYALARGPWAPNGLFMRDDIIVGGPTIFDMYRACALDNAWMKALADQQDALSLVESMADDLAKARPHMRDERQARALESSIEYERSLIEALHSYLSGMFRYYSFRDGGSSDRALAKAALDAFDRLDQSWRIHTQVITQLPGTATPYRDAGMLATVDAARRELSIYR